MLFEQLSAKEIVDISNVVKQDVKSRPAETKPHKLMVWFPVIANKLLHSNTPPNGFCVTRRPADICSDSVKEYIEILWDRGFVPIEVVRDTGACYYFRLPKNLVTERTLDDGVYIERQGEDPSQDPE
jgi:hypothetical protein